jgi:predicted CXXCH cytochrome family protein
MKALFSKARLLMFFAICFTSTATFALVHSDIFGCDPCHVVHDAKTLPGVPLWSGNETTTTFTMYSSATFKGAIDGQPSGNSKLCLSCHDGANPNFSWLAPEMTFGSEELVNSHPISFVYDSALTSLDGALKDPSQPSTLGGTIAEDLLDPESKMQCGSCHDVHTSGVGEFQLRGYDYGSQHGPELCRMCHLK